MGILSIFKKVIGSIKDTIHGGRGEEDFGLEEDFGDVPEHEEEPEAMPEDLSEPASESEEELIAPELEDESELETPEEHEELGTPEEPDKFKEPEEAPPAPPASSAGTEKILSAIKKAASKLEVLDARMSSLESKGSYQRSETERYMQYLSHLNEKLDHLQEEQMELERLLKSK